MEAAWYRSPCRGIWVVICVLLLDAPALAQGPRPGGAEALRKAGKAHLVEGRYQSAVADLEAAARLEPLPELDFLLARAYRELGELQKAVEHLERFVEAEPEVSRRQGVRDAL